MFYSKTKNIWGRKEKTKRALEPEASYLIVTLLYKSIALARYYSTNACQRGLMANKIYVARRILPEWYCRECCFSHRVYVVFYLIGSRRVFLLIPFQVVKDLMFFSLLCFEWRLISATKAPEYFPFSIPSLASRYKLLKQSTGK